MARLKSPYDDEAERQRERLKKRMQNSDTVKYTMNIPTKLHIAVKRKAIMERTTIKDVIMGYLLNYIEKE